MTPSIYTMDHPGFIVCNSMEKSIGLKRFSRVMFFYSILQDARNA